MGSSKNLVQTTILTDAGWDTVTYDEALAWFCAGELKKWWAHTLDEIAEERLLLDMDHYAHGCTDQPRIVDVIVAKAAFCDDKWFQFVALTDWSLFRSEYEVSAIRLGMKLREFLERPDLQIVNDNKPAVKSARKECSGVIWQPSRSRAGSPRIAAGTGDKGVWSVGESERQKAAPEGGGKWLGLLKNPGVCMVKSLADKR